jgi:hypothetical protein
MRYTSTDQYFYTQRAQVLSQLLINIFGKQCFYEYFMYVLFL